MKGTTENPQQGHPQHHSSLSSSPAPVRPGSVAWSIGRLAEEKVGRQVHQAST